MCEDVPFVTDRRPCALSSRLFLSLSRSSTSRNRKKTSLHSGWVSNNLLPRRQQQQEQQPSVSLSEPLKEQRVTFISSPKTNQPRSLPNYDGIMAGVWVRKYNPGWGDVEGKRANSCFPPYLAVWTNTAVSIMVAVQPFSQLQSESEFPLPGNPCRHFSPRGRSS